MGEKAKRRVNEALKVIHDCVQDNYITIDTTQKHLHDAQVKITKTQEELKAVREMPFFERLKFLFWGYCKNENNQSDSAIYQRWMN